MDCPPACWDRCTSAAIIGTPVAVTMAMLLGADPRPFVMAAAGYRFRDFVRAGLPLALLLWLTLTWLLAREYALI